MKPAPAKLPITTNASANSRSEPEEAARLRAAALAGISPPTAGNISQADWDEFNRELDAFMEGRQFETVSDQSKPTETPTRQPTTKP